MLKRIFSHADCTHPVSSYHREVCRYVRAHKECDHLPTVYWGKVCEQTPDHVECDHSMHLREFRKCPRYRGGQEKE